MQANDANRFKINGAAFVSGCIFAAGLLISGMTQPHNIIDFLSWGSRWNPALALVMVGAITVHALAYHLWLKKRGHPIWAQAFRWSTLKGIDRNLVGGAALFGIGWGLSGYCPGPAVVSVASLRPSVLLFVGSMAAGMILFHWVEKLRSPSLIQDASQTQNQGAS